MNEFVVQSSGEPSSDHATSSSGANDELICIARIVRPHGIKGEVTAVLLTDFPERFEQMKEVQVKSSLGSVSSLKLERFRFQKDRVLLKFIGYDDMNRAELLRNSEVVIKREQLVKLPENSYFEFDLVDCSVSTIDDAFVGLVTDVRDFGAAPLLIVHNEDKEYMIPMVESICKVIDIKSKKIVIDPPSGLLDLD